LGTNSVRQSIILLADLKLGHYMKISPMHMVICQLYGSLLGAFVNTVCCFWVMDSMDHILGKGDWQMSGYSVFYNAGAIWYI
jgi:OPT oligopeptide transporter protein